MIDHVSEVRMEKPTASHVAVNMRTPMLACAPKPPRTVCTAPVVGRYIPVINPDAAIIQMVAT